MPFLSRLFIRTSLLAFLLGFFLGAALLSSKAVGEPLRYFSQLTVQHLHLLFVGWFTNMIFGVSFWMFPRPQGGPSPALPALSYVLLNGGLLIRAIGEPLHDIRSGPDIFGPLLLASAVMQAFAAIIFIAAIWPRVRAARLPEALQRRPPDGDSEKG